MGAKKWILVHEDERPIVVLKDKIQYFRSTIKESGEYGNSIIKLGANNYLEVDETLTELMELVGEKEDDRKD